MDQARGEQPRVSLRWPLFDCPPVEPIEAPSGHVHRSRLIDEVTERSHTTIVSMPSIGLVHVLSGIAQPDTMGRLSDLECDQMELVIVGILSIQAGTSPRVLAQRLSCLLPPDPPSGRQMA